MDIGRPIRKFTAVPLDEPVRAPEPVQPPLPERRREHAPERREREKVDG